MKSQAIENKHLIGARKFLKLTQYEVAEQSGIARSSISKMESGQATDILPLVMFYNRTHNIPLDYLLRGEGEPFKSNTHQIKPANSNGGLLVVTEDLEGNVTVPMLNVKAAANYTTGYQTQEYFRVLDKTILPPRMTGGAHTMWVQVKDDSMVPTYFPDQWVLVKFIEKHNWKEFIDLEAHVIVTKSMGVNLKRLKNRLKTPNPFIRCRSDNRAGNPAYNVYPDDLLELWRVVGYYTNYMPNVGETIFSKVDFVEEQNYDLLNMYEKMQKEIDEIKKQLPKKE